MKTKRFILLVVLTLGLFSFPRIYSQDVEKCIQAIREDYKTVKSQIASLQKDGYAGKFYCLHTIDNKYGKSYSAVGEYKEEIWFYYDYNNEQEDDYKPKLRMVVGTTKSADRSIYFETLFSESGEILFAFEQSDNMAKRLYYNKGQIIRYSENNVDQKIDEIIDEIIWMSRTAEERKLRFEYFYAVE